MTTLPQENSLGEAYQEGTVSREACGCIPKFTSLATQGDPGSPWVHVFPKTSM